MADVRGTHWSFSQLFCLLVLDRPGQRLLLERRVSDDTRVFFLVGAGGARAAAG
jgi:hypothetical protein